MTMTLGRQTGSVVNHLYSAMSGVPTPAVGRGATILAWTDRHAGTITTVTTAKDGSVTGFVVQEDTATRTDNNGMSETQSYAYTPNPNGRTFIFKRVARGAAKGIYRENGRRGGLGVLIGKRETYHDFSF